MTRLALFALALALAGCAVTDKAIGTIQAQAAGNDRYTALTTQALAGKTDLKRDGIAPVSSAQLAATPATVRGLIKRLLESMHANRLAAHSALFQLNEGPDPQTLGLAPVKLPATKDEDDLLGGKDQ